MPAPLRASVSSYALEEGPIGRRNSRVSSSVESSIPEGSELSYVETVKVTGWCCRKRREARAQNMWVKLGSRKERQAEVRARQNKLSGEERMRWAADKVPRRTVLWRLLRRSIRSCWTGVSEAFLGCFGRIDRRTGLPTQLLEQYHFLSIAGTGPHGYVFKVVVEELLLLDTVTTQEAYSAVRVRDKAKGQLLELRLHSARALLRREVLKQRAGRLRRCCTTLGCMRPRFSHGCIVEQRRVLETSELFVEVTEFMEGGSLHNYLQDRSDYLDEFTVCHIVSRVLSALQYLHKRRLMHRDVRTAQILLGSKDDLEGAKLGDLWCVARIPRSGVLFDGRRPVDILTTAPEVLIHGAWSEKADMWSVGCVMFELLYGHPPFGGQGTALLDRICHGEPEFDTVCGAASPKAVDLMRQLLRRSPTHRPLTGAALSHKWVQEFGGDRPKAQARRTGYPIRGVKLMGKPPPCRSGMPAENLLVMQAGTFNAGFCTYMGLTSCNLDFEVSGTSGQQDFWVTSVVVSLWGTPENPKIVGLQHSARPYAPFGDVAHVVVEDQHKTEARLEPERPLRRVRVALRQNFGGLHGIAVRKVAFYGYEVRSVSIVPDLEKCTYQRGAQIHVHSSELESRTVSEQMHRSLLEDLRKGQRIAGTNRRYSVLRDICSGMPHHSSRVETPRLELPPNIVLTAAVLGLRYSSKAPPRAAPPHLRVQMLRRKEEGEIEKTLLFKTEDLETPEWNPDDVIQHGYSNYPEMFKEGLNFSSDDALSLELLFENNSGVVHLPARFGLTFYYVPELISPRSRGGQEEEEETSDGEGEGSAHEEEAQAAQEKGAVVQRNAEGTTWEEFSEHAESEDRERELQESQHDVQHHALFGALGPGPALQTESERWRPFEPGQGGEAVLWPPWWQTPEGNVVSSTTAALGEESEEVAGLGVRDTWAEDMRGRTTVMRRGSGGGWSESQENSEDAEGALSAEEEAEAARRQLIRERAKQQAEAYREEAEQAARMRQAVRNARLEQGNVGAAATLEGAFLQTLPSFQHLPSAAACCSSVVPAAQLDACSRGLEVARSFAASPSSLAARGAGPLALCGFTPAAPPPSPRRQSAS